MNARWVSRILGLIMVIVLLVLLANLQKKLVEMQQQREAGPAPSATTT
jgi:hypothetical protein